MSTFKVNRSYCSFILLISAMFLNTLNAYNIGSLPLSWLSPILFIFSAIPFYQNFKVYVPPSLLCIFFYFFLSIIALFFYNIVNGVPEMPAKASTPYMIYLSLRIINVLSYISAMIASYNLILYGYLRKMLRSYIWITAFVLTSAAYIYIAQKYGLWEPLRTRVGTGGQDYTSVEVEFQYLFHRAIGTFREPSHLAVWLAPIFLFFMHQGECFKTGFGKAFFLTAILLIIVLSGSFLGMICLVCGLFYVFYKNRKSFLSRFFSIFLLFYIIFFVASDFLGVDILSALIPRLDSFFEEGFSGTNRSYIYLYLQDNPPPIIGQGLGNSSLIFANLFNQDLITPIINLFLSIWYEAGILGFFSILLFFIWPFYLIKTKDSVRDPILIGCLGFHVSYLVSYFGMVPELSAYHAVILGTFFGYIRNIHN